ncbi:hypothetical protein LTR08_001521 [Meristemomyces frigidus]|nr:hypothetical protein LTR08_001521 [Meristemomyces frigidus]
MLDATTMNASPISSLTTGDASKTGIISCTPQKAPGIDDLPGMRDTFMTIASDGKKGGWYHPVLNPGVAGDIVGITSMKDWPKSVVRKIMEYVASAEYPIGIDEPHAAEDLDEIFDAICATRAGFQQRDVFWDVNTIFDGMNAHHGGFSNGKREAGIIKRHHEHRGLAEARGAQCHGTGDKRVVAPAEDDMDMMDVERTSDHQPLGSSPCAAVSRAYLFRTLRTLPDTISLPSNTTLFPDITSNTHAGGGFHAVLDHNAASEVTLPEQFGDLPDSVMKIIMEGVASTDWGHINVDDEDDHEACDEIWRALCATRPGFKHRNAFWRFNTIFDGMNAEDGGFSTPEEMQPLIKNIHIVITLDSELEPTDELYEEHGDDSYDFGMEWRRLDGRTGEGIEQTFPNAEKLLIQFHMPNNTLGKDVVPGAHIASRMGTLAVSISRAVKILRTLEMRRMPRVYVCITDEIRRYPSHDTKPTNLSEKQSHNIAYQAIAKPGHWFFAGTTDLSMSEHENDA